MKSKSSKASLKVGTQVTTGSGRSYVVTEVARRSSPRAPRLCILRPASKLAGPACVILPEGLVKR